MHYVEQLVLLAAFFMLCLIDICRGGKRPRKALNTNQLIHIKMKQVTIKEVKRGDFFRLTNNENAPLWVRGYYYRPDRVYEAYKYDDVSCELFAKATRRVWVEDYE